MQSINYVFKLKQSIYSLLDTDGVEFFWQKWCNSADASEISGQYYVLFKSCKVCVFGERSFLSKSWTTSFNCIVRLSFDSNFIVPDVNNLLFNPILTFILLSMHRC